MSLFLQRLDPRLRFAPLRRLNNDQPRDHVERVVLDLLVHLANALAEDPDAHQGCPANNANHHGQRGPPGHGTPAKKVRQDGRAPSSNPTIMTATPTIVLVEPVN